MTDKINLLDSELSNISSKYTGKAPDFKGDTKSVADRFSYYSSIKLEFITELNSIINPFLKENQSKMTMKEIDVLNSIIRKHERSVIYGFNFPSDMA